MGERKDFKILRISYFSLIGAFGFGFVAISKILVIKNFGIFLLIAALFGIVLGYALAKSAILCFPQLDSLRRCLICSGIVGGGIYLPLTGSGGVFFYFPGLILFAIAWSLCGQTFSSKLKITMSIIVADLISTLTPSAVIITIYALYGEATARGFLDSRAYGVYNLFGSILKGYLINFGLLFGYLAAMNAGKEKGQADLLGNN